MQWKVEKCREMQRNAEPCSEMKKNEDKRREMQICRDILLAFMTHGNVIIDIFEPPAFRKYSTCWVLQKFEEPCRILKKFVHACMVNVIHAIVLLGFVLWIED